jgi:FYVE/RhoGEF/PH domain-containing protein 5/6
VFPLLEGEAEPALPASESQASHLTLSGFPAWQSISMPVLGLPARQASALLAVDLGRPGPSRHVSEADDGGSPRVKIRAPSRPRSYVQILEDFQAQLGTSPPVPPPRLSSAQSGESGTEPPSASDAEDEADPTPSLSDEHLARGGSPRRKEDTVRRHKRFSVPAMALQTTPVTAKAAGAKRFSLVLGRDGASVRARAAARRPLDNGPAATKLQELLGRRKPQDAR